MLLNEDYGLVPYILRAMFIPTQAFFSGPLAPFAIVTIDVWQWTPFMILVLSAGMQTIPKEPIEAAIVDGTTYRQRLRYVLLPMLKPIIEIAVLFRLIGALKTFDIIWITTEGGPMNLTSTLSTLAYINSFIIFHVDKAAILTVLNLLLTLILTTYFLKKFFLQTG
jgi:multiple sugar transport system permease protein